jgi:hypothetical protein
MYLYARIVAERQEQRQLANSLTTKHPNFAWGHFLTGSEFEDGGDYDNAILEYDKAAALAPSIGILQKRAADTRYGYLAVTAAPGYDVLDRWEQLHVKSGHYARDIDPIAYARALKSLPANPIFKLYKAFSTGKESAAELDKIMYKIMFFQASNWNQISKAFPSEPAKGRSFEVLALTSDLHFQGQNLLIVKLYIRNKSATDIVLKSSDVREHSAARCFTASGDTVEPTKDIAMETDVDEKACRSCTARDIRIPAGETGWAYATFSLKNSGFSNCAFFNIPESGGVVNVRMPVK